LETINQNNAIGIRSKVLNPDKVDR